MTEGLAQSHPLYDVEGNLLTDSDTNTCGAATTTANCAYVAAAIDEIGEARRAGRRKGIQL
ncbi:hypothetical protein [Nocardia pseudovaccinii]|uniref:hypothetical protein n=1 Tax=Nocardia pseudovaccinii TaxID=189540 RepID=UPI0007A38C2B|nr:hypothetical protein [Nocardia pseudovaccinii]